MRPLSREFADAVRAAAERTGALVIADEVQSGLGRTGYAFYAQELGLSPDLVAVGKALGGGVPIGAALVRERIAAAVSPATTAAPTAATCWRAAPASTSSTSCSRAALLEHVQRVGGHFERRLTELASKQPMVKELRGVRASCAGSESTVPPRTSSRRRARSACWPMRTSKTVVRLLPPLTITETEIDEAVSRLDAAMTAVAGGAR